MPMIPALDRRRQMTSFDELKTTIRRNQLLGMWAAEKLGLVGEDADNYAKALATDTVDPERNDMFSRLRADFDAAGVIQSDQQILSVMERFTLEASGMQPTAGDSSDGAAVTLARKLSTR
jgi:hypothetical protein